MFKLNTLAGAVALALMLPSVAFAEVEVSGEAKVELGLFTNKGTVTGGTSEHKAGDTSKSEASLKLFINSEVGEESSVHAELLLATDGEGASDRLKGGEPYSQYEVLRELYIDTAAGGWDFRLGKQQVVWGTADGIKLLDMINPTDFRELNQNASEDSRIPVWMINAEKDLDSGANIQVIVSEAKANFISGLGEDGKDDAGAPFLFKGVDTITGATNGFTNIANDMGHTSGIFGSLLQFGGLKGLEGGPMSFQTVSSFTGIGTSRSPQTFAQVAAGMNASLTGTNLALFNQVFMQLLQGQGFSTGDAVLNSAANDGENLFSAFTGYLQTSLVPAALGVANYAAASTTEQQQVDSVNFLLNAMGVSGGANLQDDTQRAGFAASFGSMTAEQQAAAFNTAQVQGLAQTFTTGTTNQFGGALDTANPTSAFDYMGNTTFATFNDFVGMTTEYRNKHKDASNQNIAFRFKDSTESGMNYSLNFASRYDANPFVDMHWEDSKGNKLSPSKTATTLNATTGQVVAQGANGSTTTASSGTSGTYDVISLDLRKADGTAYNPDPSTNEAAKLVFEEDLQQVSTIGASFDTAIDTSFAPIVLRGEFSYDKGVMQPVVDLDELSIGNLTEALKMEETNMFKYVLGVDVTVMSNLLVSTQLIQFYNLDYIDSGNRYTGDFSSMSLTNGLNKGDEVETFISFFLSKPFGDDGQHRWNNIVIQENGGGYWNRFDVEYSFNDELVGTVELNSYWGDEDTTFGQFKKSSNLQLGLKYIF